MYQYIYAQKPCIGNYSTHKLGFIKEKHSDNVSTSYKLQTMCAELSTVI